MVLLPTPEEPSNATVRPRSSHGARASSPRGESADTATTGTTCRAEFLVAFRCHGRYFCPSCHARRLAEWSLWLDEHLLARVPYRQVVLTLPKRLRAYWLHDRRRLGRLSRVAYRTLRHYLRAARGEPEVVPGVITCVQTFGARAPAHPHLHLRVTDGACRRDGTPHPESERRRRRQNTCAGTPSALTRSPTAWSRSRVAASIRSLGTGRSSV